MSDNEYADSSNPDGSLLHASDSKEPKFACSTNKHVVGVAALTPVAWSSDGAWFVHATGDNSLHVCSRPGASPTFKVHGVLVGHSETVTCMAFHPMEPTLLVSAAADGLWFWNVADCSALKMISKENESDFHDGEVTAVSFAYGGQVLFTGGRDCTVKIWDVANNYSYIDTLFAHRGAPTCIAFCRGSRFLATAGLDCSIRLWDCSQLDSEPSARRNAAADSIARVLLQGSLEGHRGDVTALTWSSTGLVLFSGGRDAQIIIWDAIALSRIRIISGHKGEIRRIVLLNKEKLLLSASRDCTIKLWELGAIESKETSSGSLSLADIFKPDSGATDAEFTKIGSEAPDKLVSTLPAHSTELERCEVNPRFPLMATCSGFSCIRVWRIEDVSQPSLLQEIAGHCKPIASLKMFHNGRHALLGAQDHCVSVVEVQTMRRLATMQAQGSVKTLCISANETTAFIGSTDYVITAFSLVKESSLCFKQFASFIGHSGRILALAISGDGILISSGRDSTIRSWKPDLKAAVNTAPEDQLPPPVEYFSNQVVRLASGNVTALSFSRKGMLASGSDDHVVSLWHLDSVTAMISVIWTSRGKIDVHDGLVSCMSWGRAASTDVLFSGSSDSTIKVWQLADGNFRSGAVQTARWHQSGVSSLAISTSGSRLASCSSEGTIIWGVQANRITLLCSCYIPTFPAAPLCLDSNDDIILQGDEVGVCRSWSLDMSAWTASSSDKAGVAAAINQFQWGQVALHSRAADLTQESAVVSGESRVPTAGSQIVQQRGEFSETMSPQGQKIERLSFEN